MFHTLRHFFLLALLVTTVAMPRVKGQSFQPLPAALVSQEVALNQANECYLYFDNPTGDTLHLKWRQLEISQPAGWDIDLCDYGTCYIGIPPNGTMNVVFDTIRPYLKLIVQPGANPGAAWCWFRVQEVGDANNFADVYFSLFTPGTTATQVPEPTSWRVFPNPAHDWLVIDNPSFQTVPARLLTLTGQVIWQENIAANTRTRIPLTDWPTGLYFLQMDTQTRRVVVER